MNKEDFEDDELTYIADCIKEGYRSGMTPYGSTWSLDVDFDYDNGLADDELED